MKFRIYYLIYLWPCLFSVGCNSSGNPPKDNEQLQHIDSFESAVPHGSSLPAAELSYEDKLKLAKAVGKKATLITVDSLKEIIKNDTSGWCLYSFWNLDCGKCLEQNINLNKIFNSSEIESKLTIRYINTINLYPTQVNEYIRENGIVDDVFTIPTDTLDNWTREIDVFWNGELPALLLINNTDGSRLFYQQEFSGDELKAILETLIL